MKFKLLIYKKVVIQLQNSYSGLKQVKLNPQDYPDFPSEKEAMTFAFNRISIETIPIEMIDLKSENLEDAIEEVSKILQVKSDSCQINSMGNVSFYSKTASFLSERENYPNSLKAELIIFEKSFDLESKFEELFQLEKQLKDKFLKEKELKELARLKAKYE